VVRPRGRHSTPDNCWKRIDEVEMSVFSGHVDCEFFVTCFTAYSLIVSV
jgi:hypothetical protein